VYPCLLLPLNFNTTIVPAWGCCCCYCCCDYFQTVPGLIGRCARLQGKGRSGCQFHDVRCLQWEARRGWRLGLLVTAIKEIVRFDARRVRSRKYHPFESLRMLKGCKATGCKASPGTQLGVARDKRRRHLKNGDDALAGRRDHEEDLDRKILRDTTTTVRGMV